MIIQYKLHNMLFNIWCDTSMGTVLTTTNVGTSSSGCYLAGIQEEHNAKVELLTTNYA